MIFFIILEAICFFVWMAVRLCEASEKTKWDIVKIVFESLFIVPYTLITLFYHLFILPYYKKYKRWNRRRRVSKFLKYKL